MAATVACGGGESSGGPTTPVSTVATVQVSGAPSGPTLVGSTVQLVATPLNASGAIVTDQRVTWSSSDTALASVGTSGVVTVRKAGTVTITAASGSASGQATLDLRGGGPLGTGGGTLAVLDSTVTLTVPASALPQTTVLLVRPLVGGVVEPRMVGGTAFEVGPEALQLARAGTLTLRYAPSRLATGTVESSLQLYTLSSGAWVQVRGSTVDRTTRTVTGTFWRAGSYAVVATPVSRITVAGALTGGALYVGQGGQLTGTAYDANGDVLAGRTLTWTSSDAAVARVDSTGAVTAVGAGTATITATADGQSASVALPVLGAPAASWRHTTEWSTYQGDGRHTGAIDATLDPRAFRELWSVAGVRGPVTLGDDKVYGISQRSVIALDAMTGVQRWAYDLGSRDSFGPPGFGNGTVYLQTGGHQNSFVWGLAASDGALRFRTAFGNQWSSWYAPVAAGSAVYVAAGYYGGMSAYTGTTGENLWTVALNQYDQWTPAVANGLVYAYTGSYSPKVSVVDAATGRVSYEIADPQFEWRGWSMNLAPVLGTQNDLLALPDSRLVSFDLGSRTIRWQVKGFTSAWGASWQVTVSDGVVYALNGAQVQAHRESDGALLWTWPVPTGAPSGTMIATDNLLFVSTGAATFAVDLASHRQVWSYPMGGMLAMGANGVLYIAGASKLVAVAVR